MTTRDSSTTPEHPDLPALYTRLYRISQERRLLMKQVWDLDMEARALSAQCEILEAVKEQVA